MINQQQSGFTLLEVLLAVSITAMIGIGASQLLSSTISTKNKTDMRGQQLKEIQRMDFWLKRDITQLAGRKVKDQSVRTQPVDELIAGSDSDYSVEFSRSGLSPLPTLPGNKDLEEPRHRSNMQRVAYALRSHDSDYCKDAIKSDDDESSKQCFVRIFWPVLDLASDSQPIVQLLLDDIDDVRFLFRGQLLDLANPENTVTVSEWQEEWPGPYLTPNLTPDLVQVKMEIKSRILGDIYRTFEVPRVAFK